MSILKMSNENNMKYKTVLIEGAMIFSLLIFGFILESFSRELLFYDDVFHVEVVYSVLIRSFVAMFMFVLLYRSIMFILPYFRILASQEEEKIDIRGRKKISFMNDVTIILGLILVSFPVRPILQKTFVESDMEGFSYYFVKYDAIPSIVILTIPTVILIYYIMKYRKGYMKHVHLVLIIFFLCFVGFLNNSRNYDARVLESRESWITRDWDKQQIDAEQALLSAKSNKEKATAYFWLGVSENRKKSHSKAIEYQLKAIALLPEYAAAHASLANGYLAEGNFGKSLEHSKKCIEYDSNYAWCYQALGNYCYETNDIDNAILSYKKAIELDSGNRELKNSYEHLLKIKVDKN